MNNAAGGLMTNGETLREQYERDGFLVVPQLLAPQEVAELRAICDDVFGQWLDEAPERERAANATNMAYLTEPRYFTREPHRLTALLELIADERLRGPWRRVFGRDLLFHNTQYFFNPATETRAGDWHRDGQFGAADDEAERRRYAGTIGVHVHVALLPDENFEIVPGSHARWDTPEEAAIRKGLGGRRKDDGAMPGAARVRLGAGDACFFDAWSTHRGNYVADVPRRTFDVIYGTQADWATPPPTCFLTPGVLESLSPAARGFFARFVAAHREKWARGEYDY
jgi:hypothetical protein